MSIENPIHLGDGAYVRFDGYGITLTANHHDPELATDRVYLEPSAVQSLFEWYEALKKAGGA